MTTQYSLFSGFTPEGEKVRPSDWAVRLALLTATIKGKRMKYHTAVIPFICNGDVCLRVDVDKLKTDCPHMYHDIMFALKSLNVVEI